MICIYSAIENGDIHPVALAIVPRPVRFDLLEPPLFVELGVVRGGAGLDQVVIVNGLHGRFSFQGLLCAGQGLFPGFLRSLVLHLGELE